MNEIKWREVPFEIMLKCDEEIKCDHWLLNNSYKTGGIDLMQPMLFNEFLQQIGKHLTSMNCKSLFANAKWYVIDDGVQPDFFMKDDFVHSEYTQGFAPLKTINKNEKVLNLNKEEDLKLINDYINKLKSK